MFETELDDIFEGDDTIKAPPRDETINSKKGVSLKKLLAKNKDLEKLITKEKKATKENRKLKKQVEHMKIEREKALSILAKWADKHYNQDKKVKKISIPKKDFELLFTIFNRIE